MSTLLPVVEPNAIAAEPVRFHLSLNVDDLARSVAFFASVLDCPPTKHAGDYAKFDLVEPPLVLSLEPCRAPLAGKLNHLGFRLPTAAALVAMQARLEIAGIGTTREEGVECCYARQTKFWFNDPDGNMWEVYVVDEDIDHCGPAQLAQVSPTDSQRPPAPAIWAHRLGEKLPIQIYAESTGVDDVLLQGTFNDQVSPDQSRQILSEVLRILKPAGRITLHQLTAFVTLPMLSKPLPGPAAQVRAVPSAEQLILALEAAGLIGLHFEKLDAGACLTAEGVECRETRLVGYKPPTTESTATCEVLYRGPFREVQDDRGQTFRRGVWTQVGALSREQLQSLEAQSQFVIRTAPERCG